MLLTKCFILYAFFSGYVVFELTVVKHAMDIVQFSKYCRTHPAYFQSPCDTHYSECFFKHFLNSAVIMSKLFNALLTLLTCNTPSYQNWGFKWRLCLLWNPIL